MSLVPSPPPSKESFHFWNQGDLHRNGKDRYFYQAQLQFSIWIMQMSKRPICMETIRDSFRSLYWRSFAARYPGLFVLSKNLHQSKPDGFWIATHCVVEVPCCTSSCWVSSEVQYTSKCSQTCPDNPCRSCSGWNSVAWRVLVQAFWTCKTVLWHSKRQNERVTLMRHRLE